MNQRKAKEIRRKAHTAWSICPYKEAVSVKFFEKRLKRKYYTGKAIDAK